MKLVHPFLCSCSNWFSAELLHCVRTEWVS